MLVSFRFKNFLSFKNEQYFSLEAKRADASLEGNLFSVEGNKSSLLHVSTVYGANASGKSNFINALTRMASFVLESAKNSRGDEIDTIPFLLSPSCKTQPSEFEIVFFQNSVKYVYGFSLTRESVHDEWLYYYPNHKNRRVLFERILNEETKEKVVRFGPDLILNGEQDKQFYNSIVARTNNEQLFLSKSAAQDNSIVLAPVYDWFKNTLIFGDEVSAEKTYQSIVEGRKEEILSFLRAADLGIVDLDVQTKKFDKDSFLKQAADMPVEFQNKILNDLSDKNFYKLTAIHLDSEGNSVGFPLRLESSGTQKMIEYASFILEALSKGKVLIFDELHADLHPLLLEYLVGLFNNAYSTAQLIFTTHETNLLDPKKLRRDQIWFVDKNHLQESDLYSFSEFKARTDDRQNWEKRYLKGFYGGIPYVKVFNLGIHNGQ